jgi:hypothetical protein
MLDAVSSALTGFSAATRRYEAAANTFASQDVRGPGVSSPIAPANGAPGGPPPNEPPPVEETGGASGGPAAGLRNTTPSYLTVLDPNADNSDTGSGGSVTQASAEAAEENQTDPDASAASAQTDATEQSQARQRAIQATNELVRKLYDLG